MADRRLRGVVHGTRFDFFKDCQNNARGKYPISISLHYNGEKVTTTVRDNTITFSAPSGLNITFELVED